MKKVKDEWGNLSTICPYIKNALVRVGSLYCQECKSNLTKVSTNKEWVLLKEFECKQEKEE